MKRLVFLFLLWASIAGAAQPFTIPQGTTVFGPFSVTTLKHRAVTSLDRPLWTDPNIQLQATLNYSTTGSSGPWLYFCSFGSKGVTPGIPTTEVNCPIPTGATHVQIITVVTGGDVVLSSSPSFSNQ